MAWPCTLTRWEKRGTDTPQTARLSTGPRTPDGKAASSRNGRTHGLFCRQAALTAADGEEIRQVAAGLRRQFDPRNAAEGAAVDRAACEMWRLGRVVAVERGWIADALQKERDLLADAGIAEEPSLGMAVKGDFQNGLYERLRLYEMRMERSMNRAIEQLYKAQDRRYAAQRNLAAAHKSRFDMACRRDDYLISEGRQPHYVEDELAAFDREQARLDAGCDEADEHAAAGTGDGDPDAEAAVEAMPESPQGAPDGQLARPPADAQAGGENPAYRDGANDSEPPLPLEAAEEKRKSEATGQGAADGQGGDLGKN